MDSGKAEIRYPIQVLQLTDTHLFKDDSGQLLGVDTFTSLKDVIDFVLETKGAPDVVLLTGDLSQDETPASYQRLVELVRRIPAPKYYLPGNHDRPAVMAEVFAAGQGAIEPDRGFVWGRWQIILLNSTIPDEVGGHLDTVELSRLEKSLSENPDLFAMVCLHHHPLSVSSSWIDTIGVDNGAELFEVIDRHANVRGLLWGHVHQQYDSKRQGVVLMATPSTCVQFRPKAAEFGVDAQAPGCRWIELDEDGTISTEVHRLTKMPAGLDLASPGY